MACVAADPPIDPSLMDPRRRGSRSPEVRALTALLFGAAACLLAAVLFPMSERAPVTLGWWTLGRGALRAGAAFGGGDRVPRWVLFAENGVITVINSVLVTQAATTGGAACVT